MLPVVLNQLRSLLKADGAALVMRSAADDEMVVALARGTWADWTGLHIALDEDPIGHIFSRASARPYMNNAVDGDPHLARSALMNGMRAVACVPLIAENQTIGVLAIGRETEIADNELRLLAAIGDISANALHRAHIVETLEQRVAERTAELERQRQRMQAILDTAGDGIVITATDWTIEYVNPAQEQMSGFSAAEVIGQTTHIWHSGQTPRAVYDDMPSILTRGETWRGEVTHRRKDGTLYDVALTITPLRDDDGQVTDFVGIHRDISRQKELDRLKSKFVSDVSHELRTPVTNLKLYVAMLEHGKPEKRAQYMNTLNEQSDRLVQLVEDILDLSRLELGADKVQFAPVNLNVLARQVVDAHQPMAEAAGLALTFTPDPELASVWGEHNQLAQVITNLVTNAIRYTPAGQVQVSTRLREGQACLEVRDTGTGIYAEDIPHLFERFYRGQQRAGQPITPGTGLGLAIVKEIVDLHTGEITVSSQVGVGTTLTVCLPRHPSTED
jgi:PAS domain S-box-containing protein